MFLRCVCCVCILFSMVEKYLMAFRPPPHLESTCPPPAVVLCGDFNSTPDSAVYQLLVTGTCDRLHIDLTSDRHGLLSELNLGHHISLKSAYAVVSQQHQLYTPSTSDEYICMYLCIYICIYAPMVCLWYCLRRYSTCMEISFPSKSF